MNEHLVINFAFGFCLFLLGLMFLYGYFHKNYKRKFSLIIDFDYLFFRGRNELIWESDKLAFWVCSLMSVFTIFNGLLILFFKNTPNVSMIFIVFGFLGSWLIKYLFLLIYKNSPIESVPKFWSWRKYENKIE